MLTFFLVANRNVQISSKYYLPCSYHLILLMIILHLFDKTDCSNFDQNLIKCTYLASTPPPPFEPPPSPQKRSYEFNAVSLRVSVYPFSGRV